MPSLRELPAGHEDIMDSQCIAQSRIRFWARVTCIQYWVWVWVFNSHQLGCNVGEGPLVDHITQVVMEKLRAGTKFFIVVEEKRI